MMVLKSYPRSYSCNEMENHCCLYQWKIIVVYMFREKITYEKYNLVAWPYWKSITRPHMGHKLFSTVICIVMALLILICQDINLYRTTCQMTLIWKHTHREIRIYRERERESRKWLFDWIKPFEKKQIFKWLEQKTLPNWSLSFFHVSIKRVW